MVLLLLLAAAAVVLNSGVTAVLVLTAAGLAILFVDSRPPQRSILVVHSRHFTSHAKALLQQFSSLPRLLGVFL